jgi:hypothetical protein
VVRGLCRGTPEPHPWLPRPARRPGFRSCWGQAGPAFSVGAPVAGRTRAGPGPALPGPGSRSGPGASGGFDGGPGRLWGVPTLGCWAPPALFPPCRVTHCLCVCLHCDCRRAARACFWTREGGRDDASTLSGAAHGAAPLRCAGALCPEQCASQDLIRAVGLIAGRSRKRELNSHASWLWSSPPPFNLYRYTETLESGPCRISPPAYL